MDIKTAIETSSASLFKTTAGVVRNRYPDHRYISIGSNNVYTLNIRVPYTPETHRIPVCAVQYAMEMYQSRHDNLLIPLYGFDVCRFIVRASSSLIRKMLNPPSIYRVFKLNTVKGETYYGGTGMVFDRSMTPLMMTSLKCAFTDVNTSGGEFMYRMDDPVIHLHPKVFTSDDTFSKIIVRNILPYVLDNGIYIYGSYRCVSFPENRIIPKVEVSEDINRFVFKPVVRNIDDNEINEMLKTNADSLCKMIDLY